MCLLTYYPTDVQPDSEALRNGAISNRDGHGFAIATRGGLIVRKGTNAEKTITLFEQMRRRHPDGPALFHSRFGTAGVYGKFNVHPFRLRGDRRTVLGHNGILPSAVQPGKKDRRCDTRIMAEDVLPWGFGDLNNEDNRLRLGEWITKANKLVILTVNPNYQQQSYIINESAGTWDDTGYGNTWYSNTAYEDWDYSWSSSASTTGPGVTDVGKLPSECPVCHSAVVGRYGNCYECGSCVFCTADWDDCYCYNYAAARKEKEEADSPEWLKWVHDQQDKPKAIEA